MSFASDFDPISDLDQFDDEEEEDKSPRLSVDGFHIEEADDPVTVLSDEHQNPVSRGLVGVWFLKSFR